jgi:hypothetical protein
MTASRIEYLKDLIEDCEVVITEFEDTDTGCFVGEGRANIIAAMILADSLNGLRKAIHGRMKE